MFEGFISYIEAEKRFSPLTVAAYRDSLNRFAVFATDGEGTEDMFDPLLVTGDDVREWVAQLSSGKSGDGTPMAQSKLGPASVNRHISALKAYYRYLLREGAAARNPTAGVRFQKKPSRLPVYIEQSRMECAIAPSAQDGGLMSMRNRLIIMTLYATGIRLAELIAIDRQDARLEEGTLKVQGKGGRERIIPLIGMLCESMKAYIEQINSENICDSGEKALFLGSKGRRITRTEAYRVVNGVLAAAGVQGKRSPHVLRHTFATHLLGAGAGLRDIQELLGHTSLAATQVYTHSTVHELQTAYMTAHPRAKKQK